MVAIYVCAIRYTPYATRGFMSRDFILIFSGGMVSLVTTLVVLFIADYFSRRAQTKPTQVPDPHPGHPPERIQTDAVKDDRVAQ